MNPTRRETLLAAGLVPFQLAAANAQPIQGGPPGLANGGHQVSPAVVLGTTPSLPDKASFSSVSSTYLNSAGSHPAPDGAIRLSKLARLGENGDSVGFFPDRNRVRAYFAKLINADVDEIAFVPNTSIGESFVCTALGLPGNGAHVVSDELHFVGSQYMYEEMSKRGIEVTWVKMKDGRILLEDLDRAIVKGKTKLVAISAICFVNGFQHDLKRVCEAAHAKGALVHADIIQAAGAVPLDVKDCNLDSASCASPKWLMGGGGTAFLYVRKSVQAKMRPPYYHFTQLVGTPENDLVTHVFPHDASSNQVVDSYVPLEGAEGLFSQGYRPPAAALAGLEYSLPYIMAVGVKAIQAHAEPLVDRLKAELPRKGYKLLTPLENRSAIVTCVLPDAQKYAPLMQAANIKITLRWNHMRIAPTVFNDMSDIERLLSALPQVA